MPVLSNLEGLLAGLPHGRRGRPGLLALDVSKRAIGVAGADPSWRLATPITSIRRRRWADDVAALRRIVEEREAVMLVVGWPLNMDGSEGPRCRAVRAFADNLDAALRPVLGSGLTILLWDERLSTFAAEELAAERGLDTRRRGAPDVDALAAAAILQDLLDTLARRLADQG